MTKLVILSALLLTSYTGCKAKEEMAEIRLPPGDWIGRCVQTGTAKSPRRKQGAFAAVADRADILGANFESELSRMLEAFHAETCHQLVVVTIPSLEDRPIEEYSLEVANKAGFGYAGFNNGVMLLIVPEDRQARIEVGCGLEDAITDSQAAAIMKDDLIPAFRAGNYEAGVRAGVLELIELARKKHIPDAYRPQGCPSWK